MFCQFGLFVHVVVGCSLFSLFIGIGLAVILCSLYIRGLRKSSTMSAKGISCIMKFKQTVISYTEDNGNHSAAEQFGVDRACVIRWRIQQNQIVKGAVTCKMFT